MPRVEDMTDRQRRWWFAQVNPGGGGGRRSESPHAMDRAMAIWRRSLALLQEEHRPQLSSGVRGVLASMYGSDPPPWENDSDFMRSNPLPSIRDEKVYEQGRMDAWRHMHGTGERNLPDHLFRPDYEDGFEQGIREVLESVERMKQEDEIRWRKSFIDSLTTFPWPTDLGVKDRSGSKGGDVKYPSADELGKRLGTSRDVFHRDIEKAILKECGPEMRLIRSGNPEIGVDKAGTIWLKNLRTGKHINTGRLLKDFKR